MKKKLTLLLTLFLLIPVFTFAQNVSGKYIITKTIQNGKENNPYFIFDFNKNGQMFFMDMPFGTWKNQNNKKLIMKSKQKSFNGTAQILKLTEKELAININNAKIFFEKIDGKNLVKNNKNSGFIGTWVIKSDKNKTKILNFDAPDKFKYVVSESGMTDTYQGNWIYLPKEKSMVFTSFSPEMRGKYKVKEFNGKKFVLQNKNDIISGSIQDKDKTVSKLERLNFKYEDFPEEINDVDKLPWRDFDEMLDFLKNYKVVKYKFGSLIPNTESLRYDEMLSEIKVNLNKRKVLFTNFMVENGKKEQFSQRYKGNLTNSYNYFFPENDIMPYRVKGIEKVTVPAGTYECTVIEGMDGDKKLKLWMINNMPGIYAKIITESKDPFGDLSYTVKELVELK